MHITTIRLLSERTGKINEDQRTSKTTIGNANDFKLYNQVLISRARYLMFTLKNKKVS